jgi:glutamine amidotransferase
MIAIIDYDAGNLKSVEKAFAYLGQEAVITRNKAEILSADKVILPGVGSFGDAMNKLHTYTLVDTIKEVIQLKKPLLGICLGLQLLYSGSEEAGGVEGLGILEGDILRIPNSGDLKIPHIGWNSLEINPGARLFRGINNQEYVYFVHSYYLKSKNELEVAASTNNSTVIHASIENGNIFACQFHPEKSGEVGLKILKNFAEL